MSERAQFHGLALVGGVGLLLALAALFSGALSERGPVRARGVAQLEGAPTEPQREPEPGPAAETDPATETDPGEPAATPSPSAPPRQPLLGNTRGRAAIELMGPGGPPVPVWIEGRVLDPEGRPLAGAEVWVESSGEEVLVRGQTEADGSFSLQASYEADALPRQAQHKVVARRSLAGGTARAELWIRIPGATRALELKAWIGFDLELRFPFAIRSEVLLGGRVPGEVSKLPARTSAPTRQLPTLVEGELWVAVLGVDPSGGWWVAQSQGRVGPGAPPHWDLALDPLAGLQVSVTGPSGAASPAKLVLEPLPGNRFRESSLWRSSGVLDFADDEPDEEEGPAVPDFGRATQLGRLGLSLPPGPWRVSAFGPPGTRPAQAEIELGSGAATKRDLALKLAPGLACEFELPAGVEEGEVAVHAPAGAYLEELGPSRWRVGGLAPAARVEVYLLYSEAPAEGLEPEAEDEAPLDEPGPTSCASLRLAPGARGRLALARTGSLSVLVPDSEATQGEVWEVVVEDAGTSPQPHAIAWELGEDPLTPSGPWVTDDTPREQAWLEDRRGGMTFTNFERIVGARVRSSDIEDEAILLQDLFPGPLQVTVTGPGGFSATRSLRLAAGERAILDLR